MIVTKWYVCYNGQKEPDYRTTYFYEFIDKTIDRISFKQLYNIIGDDCIKYKELEGSKQGAHFYIKSDYDMNNL
jgi:predicted DNA-binding ArsR family transcriptional regulator